jgi:hypothetical protein
MIDLTVAELELALSGECHTVEAAVRLACEVQHHRNAQRLTTARTEEVLHEVTLGVLEHSALTGQQRDSLAKGIAVCGAAQLSMTTPVLSAKEWEALARARDFLDFNAEDEAERYRVDVLDRLLGALRGDGQRIMTASGLDDRAAEQRALDVACYHEVRRERDAALAELAQVRERTRADQSSHEDVRGIVIRAFDHHLGKASLGGVMRNRIAESIATEVAAGGCVIQQRAMRLDTHEGTVADPATPEDVTRAVGGLTAVGKAFVVLINGSEADETYVQAAGTVNEDFIIERRDGRAGDHYRGDRRLSAVELGVLLTGYLCGTPDWDQGFTWHRVRVDHDPSCT